MLHGTRSSQPKTIEQEFQDTLRHWVPQTPYAFNVLIGTDKLGLIMPPTLTGWHARAASHTWLSAEFAQPNVKVNVTPGQIRAFCWWLKYIVAPDWGNARFLLRSHYEIEQDGLTGRRDGKTDVYPDARTDTLRAEIARLYPTI